jgi:hypothetical protein
VVTWACAVNMPFPIGLGAYGTNVHLNRAVGHHPFAAGCDPDAKLVVQSRIHKICHSYFLLILLTN